MHFLISLSKSAGLAVAFVIFIWLVYVLWILFFNMNIINRNGKWHSG